jgi:Ca2+-binding RTX toxin-like protein
MASLSVFEVTSPYQVPAGSLGFIDLSRYSAGGFVFDALPAASEMRFTDGLATLTFLGAFTVDPVTGAVGGTVTALEARHIASGDVAMTGTGFAVPAQAVLDAMMNQDEFALNAALYAGADVMAADLVNRPVYFRGGAGADTITAGLYTSNSLAGEDGDDLITGADSQNIWQPSLGDRMSGGKGNDTLNARAGGDSLFGGDGNDILDGGANNDSLAGDAGNDVLLGGLNADTLSGGDGNDSLGGGTENDFLNGDKGLDTLIGDAGNDVLLGGLNADTLSGGDGNDTLAGNAHSDAMSGGAGNDLLYGDDPGSASYGTDRLFGDDGADTLFGFAGTDLLLGGAGNDQLFGGEHDDRLWGEAGADTLLGGTGADRFHFRTAADSNVDAPDQVADFSRGQGDLLDLSGVDASTLVLGNQVFAFIGAAAFALGVAGQVRATDQGGGVFLVEAETGGDALADMAFLVRSLTPALAALQETDFIL